MNNRRKIVMKTTTSYIINGLTGNKRDTRIEKLVNIIMSRGYSSIRNSGETVVINFVNNEYLEKNDNKLLDKFGYFVDKNNKLYVNLDEPRFIIADNLFNVLCKGIISTTRAFWEKVLIKGGLNPNTDNSDTIGILMLAISNLCMQGGIKKDKALEYALLHTRPGVAAFEDEDDEDLKISFVSNTEDIEDYSICYEQIDSLALLIRVLGLTYCDRSIADELEILDDSSIGDIINNLEELSSVFKKLIGFVGGDTRLENGIINKLDTLITKINKTLENRNMYVIYF
jgi:hypothetical protein